MEKVDGKGEGKESEEDWKRKSRARNDKGRGEERRRLIYFSKDRGGDGEKRREE